MKQFLLFITSFVTLFSFSQISPKREFRGAWVSTVWNVDYPSSSNLSVAQQKSEFNAQINELKIAGINAVFIQVRPSCDAVYGSSLEPWSQWLTGTPQNTAPSPYYDPLVFYVDECHKRGMELHAWINPYRAASSVSGQSFSPIHVTNTHPSWCVTYGNKKILNPGLPTVRTYVTTVVMEIVHNYDIDGVHFDDYFYPYPESGLTFNDAAAFSADPRGFTNLNDWRRDNVNIFIDRIHDSIKLAKPWVRFGVSPFGIWKSGVPSGIVGLSSFSDIYCDPIPWLQNGNVDYVLPQLYWVIGGAQDFNALSNWWGNQCLLYNRPCFAGLATYRLDPGSGNWANSEIDNQIDIVRTYTAKVPGYACFSSKSVINNVKQIQDTLDISKNKYLSLLPAMTWDNAIAPNLVTNVDHLIAANTVKLTWTIPTAATDGDFANYFVIYRFPNGMPIDLTNPVNIAGRTNQDTIAFVDNYSMTAGQSVTYCITSVDRYSNESAPKYYNVCFNCDQDAPSSQIAVSNTWKTQNFVSDFTDVDIIGGSGVEKGFYNVENFDGTRWIANRTRGFLAENFDIPTFPGAWTTPTGTWSQNTGIASQSDVSVNNTNLSIDVNQSLSNRYIYDFTAKIGGAGVNRRAGIHIFATDPTLLERGNSLLIWFRLDDDKVQFFQTNNNALGSILQNTDFNFTADVYYDFRIIYDRTTGKIQLFINNSLITTYTFSTIYSTGDFVSFRSGNSAFDIQNLNIYRSRSTSNTITVGTASTNDIIFQNPDPLTPAGKINALCIDSAENVSLITSALVNVDYTSPNIDSVVNDGTVSDIDQQFAMILSGNWLPTSDPHSGIQSVEYSIGTTALATDVVSWTNVVGNAFSTVNLPLVENQWYFVNVRSENNAGLTSDTISSDGVQFKIDYTGVSEVGSLPFIAFPNPTNGKLFIQSEVSGLVKYEVYNLEGKVFLENELFVNSPSEFSIDLTSFASGIYLVKLISKDAEMTFRVEKN